MALDDPSDNSGPIETLGVAEAKRRFSEILDRVQQGGRFVIARRGKPVVALVHPDRAGEAVPSPLGFAAFAGALADWEEVEDVVDQIYASRRRAKDRPAPVLD
jgi:prevent-host-death family protein